MRERAVSIKTLCSGAARGGVAGLGLSAVAVAVVAAYGLIGESTVNVVVNAVASSGIGGAAAGAIIATDIASRRAVVIAGYCIYVASIATGCAAHAF